jgi:hypothetical protein
LNKLEHSDKRINSRFRISRPKLKKKVVGRNGKGRSTTRSMHRMKAPKKLDHFGLTVNSKI